MATRDIIVFDFETGSRNPRKTQPTQLAALALDGRSFKLKGTFNSEMKPILDDEKAIELGFDPIEDGALKITNKTREQLAEAPDPKVVWKKFVKFVEKYNWKGTQWFAPIPAGFNIIGFDMIIIDRMCKAFGPWDADRQSQKLFHKIFSMDSLRDRMGLSKDNAHDALQDVKDTANIMIKFMKTHRAVYRNLKIDKAFADGELYV